MNHTGTKSACGLRRDIERGIADAVRRSDTRKLGHITKALQGRIAEARGFGWIALAQSFEQDLARAQAALDAMWTLRLQGFLKRETVYRLDRGAE